MFTRYFNRLIDLASIRTCKWICDNSVVNVYKWLFKRFSTLEYRIDGKVRERTTYDYGLKTENIACDRPRRGWGDAILNSRRNRIGRIVSLQRNKQYRWIPRGSKNILFFLESRRNIKIRFREKACIFTSEELADIYRYYTHRMFSLTAGPRSVYSRKHHQIEITK